MIRKYLSVSLLPLVLICSSILTNSTHAADAVPTQPATTFTLDLKPPAKWESWTPEHDTVLVINASIEADSDAIDAITSTHYTFSLTEVSDYTGFCMNEGPQSGDKKDIYFRQSDQPKDTDQLQYRVSKTSDTLTVYCKSPHTGIPIYVFVDDYGAHGILDGNVSLNEKKGENGQELDNTPTNNDTANASLSIPKDNNGNDIADGWREDNTFVIEGRAGYDLWGDDEAGPNGNTNNGDGLTVFEEYRGFWIGGEHVDTDPSSEKDLFVHSEFDEGYGYASNLPDVFTIHLIDKNNMASNNRRISRYTCGNGKRYVPIRGGTPNPQSAVYVVNASADDEIKDSHQGDQGVVAPRATVPYLVQYCRVYPHRIAKDLQRIDKHPDLDNYYKNYYLEELKGTIGHEIGHCIELDHATDELQEKHYNERHGHSIMQDTEVADKWNDGTKLSDNEKREDYADIVEKLHQAGYPYPAKLHKKQYNTISN